jgi:hypothetical protein
VLEEAPVALQQAVQHLRPVALEAGGQGQVVRPLDDVDGVDLHEPHPFDEVIDPVGRDPAPRIVEEPLRAQQQPAGRGGGNQRSRGHAGRRISGKDLKDSKDTKDEEPPPGRAGSLESLRSLVSFRSFFLAAT